MEWHEDPVRTKDEMRRAAWRGSWRMLGVLVTLLFVAAILFPILATSKSYSGPALMPQTVADEMEGAMRETGRLPTKFAEIEPRLRRRRHIPHLYSINILRLDGDPKSGRFVIRVNGNLQVWRFSPIEPPERIAVEAFAGDIGSP